MKNLADEPGASYAHCPRPASMPVAFSITGRTLRIDRVGQIIDMPLGKVEEVRLMFQPRSFAQSQMRTRIKFSEGPSVTFSSVSYRSMVFADRQDAAYGAFVRQLLKAVAKASPNARFVAGRPLFFWYAMVASAAALFAAIMLFTLYAWREGESEAALFGVIVALIGIWQMEPLIRLNRPMTFSPDDPPKTLAPDLPTPK